MTTDFLQLFRGKSIFITGHTGFKGAWLTQWLLDLGASITGYALPPAYENSLFDLLELKYQINHIEGDILDQAKLQSSLQNAKADFVFHLAAQAIVSTSYKQPLDTLNVNVMGTANILESLRNSTYPSSVVLITSDKAYYNNEWPWGYRETDRLGGKDIYSGSKGAAELVIESYIASFFCLNKTSHSIGIARAGNVIGGGDWATDRLIPDIYRQWSKSLPVSIRCPSATRPWQHVLEPLSGYLLLAAKLSEKPAKFHSEAFNFGPNLDSNFTVIDVIEGLHERLPSSNFTPFTITDSLQFNESSLLKLNCDKALLMMNWTPRLTFSDTLDYVSLWYNTYLENTADISPLTSMQINSFMHSS